MAYNEKSPVYKALARKKPKFIKGYTYTPTAPALILEGQTLAQAIEAVNADNKLVKQVSNVIVSVWFSHQPETEYTTMIRELSTYIRENKLY